MVSAAHILLGLMIGLPLLAAALMRVMHTPRRVDLFARGAAVLTGGCALALSILSLTHRSGSLVGGHWLMLDHRSALFLAVTSLVGLSSVMFSSSYLKSGTGSWLSATASHAWYHTVLFVFWAALLTIPVIANLALAWLVIDATTATSALLVAFSGRGEALEAAWKYLILTALGLSLALFGIIVLGVAQAAAHHDGLSALSWQQLQSSGRALPHEATVFAFIALIVGLAAKIGWAPVHNWLPDAHSEAPAPVSALLSAALLPTVLLVAWRSKDALTPAIGAATTGAVFIGFGLASILVAIPFLWRAMAWKRLLAYSTLEHMGIIAVGIGFGSPLALAGVAVHVAGHAFAKSLGFYAAMPLRPGDQPDAPQPRTGLISSRPRLGIAMGTSLLALAGLPPSPLFVSELMILAGGITSGHLVIAVIVAAAIALGFLGLLHAFVEGVVGEDTQTPAPAAAGAAARLSGAGS